MNNTPEQSIIRPEILASKFAAVQNYEAEDFRKQLEQEPRLAELLWFIQAMSIQPGGLKKFAEDFVDRFAERVTSKKMRTFPKGKDGRYTLEQCFKIVEDFSSSTARNVYDYEFSSLLWHTNAKTLQEDDPDAARKLQEFDFVQYCIKKAKDDLPCYLSRVCSEKETILKDPWYFEDLTGTLLKAMALHAEQAKKSLAMTEVALKVFDALDYTWSERGLSRIEGDTRFGKTESIKTWCAMHPGRARLVQTPCSNSDTDLFKAIAEALGISFSFRTQGRELKEKIEYIIRYGGLMMVFDEAHFLFPARFSTNTPPMRLNWVRTQIVDKKRPVVLVSTPQDYNHCLDKFVKATGHNIQQFLGRIMLTTLLPCELDEDDLLAVAKIHFPTLDEDYLAVIVGAAMQSESYLMAVEAIASRARYISRRDGHASITQDDLKLAIAEALPGVESVQQSSRTQRNNRQQIAINRALKPVETPVQEPIDEPEKAVSDRARSVVVSGDRTGDVSRKRISGLPGRQTHPLRQPALVDESAE